MPTPKLPLTLRVTNVANPVARVYMFHGLNQNNDLWDSGGAALIRDDLSALGVQQIRVQLPQVPTLSGDGTEYKNFLLNRFREFKEYFDRSYGVTANNFFVGYSWGGMVAMVLAKEIPNIKAAALIKSVTLIGELTEYSGQSYPALNPFNFPDSLASIKTAFFWAQNDTRVNGPLTGDLYDDVFAINSANTQEFSYVTGAHDITTAISDDFSAWMTAQI